MGIPDTLGDVNVPIDQADIIGDHAQRDPSTASNPRRTSAMIMARLFTAAVTGDLLTADIQDD
jgi:alcohol dehydrogenase class IV